MVEIETESRFPIWQTFVFQKQEVVIYQPSVEICRRNWFVDRLEPSEGSAINKYETGTGI